VPCLTTLIALSLRGRAIRLQLSKDAIVQALVRTERFQRLLDKLSVCLNDVRVPKLTRSAVKAHWADQLHQSTNGRGLEVMRESPFTSQWVNGASRVSSGRLFIKALQLRSNTLPCGATANRSVPSVCRAGCSTAETLPHLLQSCIRTHGVRIERHNRIVNLIAGKLADSSRRVFVEPIFPTFEGRRKPDIVVVHDDHAVVADVQVTWETSRGICKNYAEKVAYYQRPEVIEGVKKLTGCSSVEFTAFIFGVRGSICHDSVLAMRKLGLAGSFQAELSAESIKSTLRMYSYFTRAVL